MISPFKLLEIDRDLVCLFFATVARFEYALKETGTFCNEDRQHNAKANWDLLINTVGRDLTHSKDKRVRSAIDYLVKHPPQVQKFIDGSAVFQVAPLGANTEGGRAIEAARRVRNNLFHGGKHTPHSPAGHDEKLIECSLIILETCAAFRADIRSEFETGSP